MNKKKLMSIFRQTAYIRMGGTPEELRCAEYLKEQGMTSERTVFLELEAVRSEGMQGDKMWREMCFAHDGSIYAVAMIGSSEEDMQMLLDTVAVHDEAPEITAQPDDRTPLERFLGYFFGN